jgi:dihydroflavonol-4-reductase
MKTVLVTGATGLIGSNACVQLMARGDRVRTLARNPASADALALAALGVEVVKGDITERGSIAAAMDSIDGVIHSAALRGIPGTTVENSVGPNTLGTINVLSAAWLAGNVPVVQLLTHTFFEAWEHPLSEQSPFDKSYRNTDPYSTTKRLAYAEGMTRVADGQDIRFMIPGGGYGPTPCLDNGLFHPSYNSRILLGIQGALDPQMPRKISPVLGSDCAWVCLAALDRGKAGERYIAFGRQDDGMTIAALCNMACEMAGSNHRVEEVPPERLDDPEVIARYGTTVTGLAKQTYPTPVFDSGHTERALGYVPTPATEGIRQTIAWMKAIGRI